MSRDDTRLTTSDGALTPAAPPADTPLAALLAALDDERRHLEALCLALEDEGQALRTLTLDALLDAGRRKARAADEQAHLARRRLARLHAIDPALTTLGALAERLAPADREALETRRDALRGLLDRAAAQNRDNHVFAETGRALIDGTLRVFRGRAAGASATYGKSGRIRAGERRAVIDWRA